ncbi:hypothetical protein ACEPPN_012166 [Leptodophora sp. 'Broadleaf-Isolate-01']
MADIAFGVVGVVGVALDASTTTYHFILSIAGAPKAIKTLANHIKHLKSFLGPFHELISKPEIRDRAQNVRFIPSVENEVSGFEGMLKDLENEVKQVIDAFLGRMGIMATSEVCLQEELDDRARGQLARKNVSFAFSIGANGLSVRAVARGVVQTAIPANRRRQASTCAGS